MRVSDPFWRWSFPADGDAANTTSSSGPNGSQSWFNCGVDSSSGWSPPMLKVEQLISVDWETALAQNPSVFQACTKYIDTFTSAANKHNLPLMLLVSIAIEESSCNAGATSPGNNPTKGLFQLDSDNCPSDGDCYDSVRVPFASSPKTGPEDLRCCCRCRKTTQKPHARISTTCSTRMTGTCF